VTGVGPRTYTKGLGPVGRFGRKSRTTQGPSQGRARGPRSG